MNSFGRTLRRAPMSPTSLRVRLSEEQEFAACGPGTQLFCSLRV